MARLELNRDMLEAAVRGAFVLGGSGSQEEALRLGGLALEMGSPVLVDVDDVNPAGTLVSCSTVIVPSGRVAPLSPRSHVRAVEILLEGGAERPSGFIASECGGAGIVNGWLEGAILGIPVVDAPCNGRAHPTAEMGSMGLHLVEGYESLQAFAGGMPGKEQYVEGLLRGSIKNASNILRYVASSAGGALAVARNPVSASYAGKCGAPGAVKLAIRLGKARSEAAVEGLDALLRTVCGQLGGEVLYRGRVDSVDRFTAGGMGSGIAVLGEFEVAFWKEYMALERNGERLATFPDLIVIFDEELQVPVSSGDLLPGRNVSLMAAPRDHLILGAGMRCPDLMEPAEKIMGKEMLKYLSM